MALNDRWSPLASRRTARLATVIAMAAAALTLPAAGLAAAPSAPGPSAPAAPAPPAPPAKQVVTFGIQPSGAKAPDVRGFFNVEVQPGSSFTDHVAVTNYSTQPLSLQLAAADGTNTRTGGLALVPAQAGAQNVGSWILLPPYAATLHLAPRNRVILPFRVTVPRLASPGDHFGGITATLQSTAVSPSGQKFKLLQRVGTRLFARVGGALRPALAVESLDAGYDGVTNPFGSGRATITYRVRNVGNIALGGRQTLHLSGLFGWHAKVQAPKVELLLPGSAITEKVRASHVPPELVMSGHVSISPLIIPGAVQPSSGPFTGDVHFLALPWTLLVIVVLVAGAGYWTWRRRRKGGPADGDAVVFPQRSASDPPARATAGGRHRSSRVRSVATLFVLSCGLTVASAGTASAASPPYDDPRATGAIGLCDQHGQQVTNGDLRSRPFSWLAVSSVAAPAGYGHGKAQLLVFQPRKGLLPDAWSGYQLTASSTFTNAAHPMARATGGDAPLLWAAQAYPPQWDGYLQLRMYFTGPNLPLEDTGYPALNLRIDGNTWTAVGGAKVDCAAGSAVSAETRTLPMAEQRKMAAAAHFVAPVRKSSNAPLLGASMGAGAGVLVAGGGWLWLRRRRLHQLTGGSAP